MLAKKATIRDVEPIIRMSPGVTLGALRANADLVGPPKDQHDILKRLLDDPWHEVLIVEERGVIVAALLLVYQRQRRLYPGEIGDHLRIIHVVSQRAEESRKALFE